MIDTIKAVKILVPLICLLLVSCAKGPQEVIGGREQAQNIPAWFKDGKFGMFIHWGPYSVLGGEWKGQRIEQGDIKTAISKLVKATSARCSIGRRLL